MYAEKDGLFIIFRDSSNEFLEKLPQSTAYDVLKARRDKAQRELDVAYSNLEKINDRLGALDMAGLA